MGQEVLSEFIIDVTTWIENTFQKTLLLIFCSSLIATTVKEVDYRNISSELIIQINRDHPPFSAFEQVSGVANHEDEFAMLYENPSKAVRLSANSIIQFNRLNLPVSNRHIKLKEDIIKAPLQLEEVVITGEVKNEYFVAGIPSANRHVFPRGDNIDTGNWVESLRPKLKQRLQLASQQGLDLSEIDEPSIEPQITDIIAQEVQKMKAEEKAPKIIPSSVPGSPGIIVMAANDVGHGPSSAIPAKTQSSYRQSWKRSDDRVPPPTPPTPPSPPIVPEPTPQAVADNKDFSAYGNDLGIENQTSSSYQLSGKIFIGGGIPFNNETQIQIYREYDGVAQEVGKFWSSNAGFEINVSELKGQLVGHLISSNFGLIGRGVINLEKIQADHKTTELELKIMDLPEGLNGETVSDYSYENKIYPVGKAEISPHGQDYYFESKKSGKFNDQNIYGHSTIALRVQKTGYVDTLWLGQSCEYNRIPLMSQKKREALNGLLENKVQSVNLGGVIWGRVFIDGKPAKGATVEIAGGSYSEALYFSNFTVDPSSKKTSEDGLFAFVGLQTGIYAIKGRYQGRVLPVQILAVESGMVSYTSLEPLPYVDVGILAVNAFDNQIKDAQIYFTSTEDRLQLGETGQAIVSLPEMNAFNVLEVQGMENELPMRFNLYPNQRKIVLPLIEASWVEQIKAQFKISDFPNTGIIIGFTDAPGFQIDYAKLSNEVREVYFDGQGNVVAGGNEPGVRGFILFNVPVGLNNVGLILNNQEKIQYQAALVDETFASALMFEYTE